MTLERLVRFYRSSSDERSVLALLVANLIPLVGVLFFGWNLATILIIYWLENGIVGLWNVPRMLLAGRSSILGGRTAPTGAAPPTIAGAPVAGTPVASQALLGQGCGSSFMIVFFLVHYGLFWFVHGVFVFAITAGFISGFGGFVADPGGFVYDVAPSPAAPVWSQVWLAGLALFISHGLSFFLDYVRGGEYRSTSIMVQMFQPYGRVVVMHVTILLGAFLTFALGSPIGLLIVLVALKTALDLALHARRHRPSVSGVAGPFG